MMIQAVMLLAGLIVTEPSHEVLTLSTGEKVVVTKQYADWLRQLKPLNSSLLKQLQQGGQEPRLSAPRGSDQVMKFVDQSIRWLRQQQPREPLSNTERFLQALREASEQPLSNTERALRAIQKAANDRPLSHTERALRAFQVTGSLK